MATLTSPVSISLENEKNPWLAAAARFDEAATRLKLDDGMRKVLGTSAKEITVHIPVQLDDGRIEVFTGYRVQHSDGARSGQGRHPLRARRDARRSPRAGLLDDLEMRRGQHSLRRRQGRRHLRSEHPLRHRTGEAHPPLHRRDHRFHRTRTRRPRARRQHQRKDHGLDHGHLLHARAPHRHRRRHRQADGARRVARPPRGHRTRLHDGHPQGAQR